MSFIRIMRLIVIDRSNMYIYMYRVLRDRRIKNREMQYKKNIKKS